jgi:Family of unknown function (DUF5992)
MKAITRIAGILLFTLALEVNAGWLAWDAQLTAVTNTSGNTDSFVVLFTGGTGACASQGQVTFPRDATTSQEVLRRAYATALMALATGMKVNIYNYESDSCDRAAHIWISK